VGDTVGDPFKDTSGPVSTSSMTCIEEIFPDVVLFTFFYFEHQSLNILIKLMSIISLTMAPLIAGNGDWPADWWKGLFPVAVMIIGTYLVYHCFWKNAETIIPINASKEDVETVESRVDEHPIM